MILLPLKFPNRLYSILDRKSNIVFLQRDLLPEPTGILEKCIRYLSRGNSSIIFDFDDAIWLNYENKVRKIISISNVIIAGNNFLADYAKQYNRNVVTIPTSIDTSLYVPKAPKSSEKKIIIGWSGTASNLEYLKLIKNPLVTLSRKYDFTLKILTNKGAKNPLDIKDVNVEIRYWTRETELSELYTFDIGIMPLKSGVWENGKCGFKIILYLSLGIPSVASPTNVNCEIIKDGKNGFIASSEKDWVENLSKLIEDYNLRLSLGRTGRTLVEEKYSVKANLPLLIAALNHAYSNT
ncbi:MAG: hypothetical protein A2W23_07085 [Planctomycetes bacterium RBG_16_43_13]|nr:MAG: hypothetical protein A2W23_07085 [Planctomycetes bacterium RBG_16_43_13]